MEYKIVEIKEKKMVGLLKKTTNENMQAAKDIGLLWEKFMAKGIYSGIENKVDRKTIGLYTDYEGDYTKPYNFMTCCEVDNITASHLHLTSKIISEGKYAKFTVRGHIQQAVIDAWKSIWCLDLDRRYDCDFEVYHNNTDDINNQIIDIYISIK
ncbi:GyrI-like domain-containing protein [Wukongibacter baidiensis]|uniref:GyrI-like domain-containing protein n=1 Tax=Wukongibacter baidiensis TaxID=1723361 RepID=UPI003D7F6402